MSTLKGTNEHSRLLSASIDSTHGDSQSEYSSVTTKISNCNFVAANKKPLIAIVILLFVGLSATLTMLYLDHEGFWDKVNPIDKIWFTQTLTNKSNPQGLYPLWFKAATFNGKNVNNSLSLYRSQYGQFWNMDETQTYNYSTLIAQSQLIYNFATAYFVTKNITYYKTMITGINNVLSRFNDTDNGGFYYSINETSSNVTTINKIKNSIGHSAFMYAISTAFIVTSNNQVEQKEKYLHILNNTYGLFQEYFFDDYEGLYGNLTMNWTEIEGETDSKSQLCLMYYFEALSQVYRVAKSVGPQYQPLLRLNVIKQDILSLFDFVCHDILYQYKNENNIVYYVLYENYNKNWTEPLDEYVSLGNAYKWSYLISYFIDEGIIPTNSINPNRDYAILFLQYAIDLGYDPDLQRIHDEILNEQVKYTNPPYWTVCNAVKTLYYYWNVYAQQDNEDWLDILQNVITYYQKFYYDQIHGGIYYSKPYQLWKGNVSKLDYQCIDMTLYVTQSQLFNY